MKSPFFSVIIPTYNRVGVLARSIDSVLNQTYQNFELIIVDNGSTDATQQWIKSNYQDTRLIYQYQTGSGTPANPRNTGMSLAKGKWICLLDSDDKWLETKLHDVYKVIQNENFDVISHDVDTFLEASNSYGNTMKIGPASKNLYKDMLIFGNRLITSATSIRTDFLRDSRSTFNESQNFVMVEDYYLWLDLAKAGAKFKFLSKSLGVYTIGNLNLTANSELFYNNFNNLLRLHAFTIQQFEQDKERLWQLLKFRSDLHKIRFAKNSTLSRILGIMKMCISHPINFLILFKAFIKRKILLR